MKKVLVNSLGYLAAPSIQNANIEIEVSEEIANKISTIPLGKLGRYNSDTKDFTLEITQDEEELRLLREYECFSVINRSFMGYLMLTEDQKLELQTWYQAGLDITETGEIPKKPEGLD